MKPLPIPIPLDYADVLDMDPSNISHCNAGRRRFDIQRSIKLMDASLIDARLAGLCFVHLRPELKPALPYLCPEKKGRKRAGR
jgi:hypothetical protein